MAINKWQSCIVLKLCKDYERFPRVDGLYFLIIFLEVIYAQTEKSKHTVPELRTFVLENRVSANFLILS